MQSFPFFHNLAVLLFSEIVIFMINSKTLCRPIRSVNILMINKSESCCAVVQFCYHSYDYRPNWTPLSPITITYKLFFKNIQKLTVLNILFFIRVVRDWNSFSKNIVEARTLELFKSRLKSFLKFINIG